jgi:hypothetical protein
MVGPLATRLRRRLEPETSISTPTPAQRRLGDPGRGAPRSARGTTLLAGGRPEVARGIRRTDLGSIACPEGSSDHPEASARRNVPPPFFPSPPPIVRSQDDRRRARNSSRPLGRRELASRFFSRGLPREGGCLGMFARGVRRKDPASGGRPEGSGIRSLPRPSCPTPRSIVQRGGRAGACLGISPRPLGRRAIVGISSRGVGRKESGLGRSGARLGRKEPGLGRPRAWLGRFAAWLQRSRACLHPQRARRPAQERASGDPERGRGARERASGDREPGPGDRRRGSARRVPAAARENVVAAIAVLEAARRRAASASRDADFPVVPSSKKPEAAGRRALFVPGRAGEATRRLS